MTDEFEGRGRTGGDHVAEIVAAYVSNNHVAPGDMPALIATVHATLAGLTDRRSSAVSEAEPKATPTPAEIRKSITPDALISFIDGKRYKTLKRHLTTHGLDPHSYRKRYGLPADYPMVASAYSERRSQISKGRDFGRRQRGRSSSTTSTRR